MKFRSLVFAQLLSMLFHSVYAQNDCRPIEKLDPMGTIWVIAKDIVQVGTYCLMADLTAPRRHDYHGEIFNPDYPVLSVQTSNAVIDLSGHTINVDTGGMFAIYLSTDQHNKVRSHVTIRNGRMITRTNGAIKLNFREGSIFDDFKVMYETPAVPGFAEKLFQDFLKKMPSTVDAYPKTEFLIERMKIESNTAGVSRLTSIHRTSGLIGVGMGGAANVIRNSTIEVTDGHAAIYLFGPNQIIENNVIVFKGTSDFKSAAAIKLHQADGSIIRNNDIVIDSGFFGSSPRAAISLIDSKNVIAENNRIYGIRTLAHAWDDKSNLIDKNNEFRLMRHRPPPSAEPGVRP